MWIRLTHEHNETPMLVNLDKLSTFVPCKKSDGITVTEVCENGESSYTVRESFDEIQARISALIIPE